MDNPLSNRTKTTPRPKSRTTPTSARKAKPSRKVALKKQSLAKITTTTTTTATPEYELILEPTTNSVPIYVDPSESQEVATDAPVNLEQMLVVNVPTDLPIASSSEADNFFHSFEVTEPIFTDHEPSSFESIDFSSNSDGNLSESVELPTTTESR